MKSGKEYIVKTDKKTVADVMSYTFGNLSGVLALSSFDTDESDINGCKGVIIPSTEISSIEYLLK